MERKYQGRGAAKFTAQERFDGLTKKTSGGCWLWEGSTLDSGYGRIMVDGKTYRAHVLSHVLHKGPVPKGKVVCHSCDVPLCVNPKHLWLGTHAQNIADRQAKGRAAMGEKISNSVKLTERIVREMRELWEREGPAKAPKPGREIPGTLTYSTVGRRFGVTSTQARNIILRLSWKHVQ